MKEWTTGAIDGLALVLVIVAAVLITMVWSVRGLRDHVDRLERDVACLKHPTRAISAIGPVTIRNGKVVGGKTTPTLVICP